MSEKVELRESAGTGGIYTFSISRRVGPVVYAIAYVRLDDGVTMMSNIVDCDLDEVRIGQRVRVVMKATEGKANPAQLNELLKAKLGGSA